MITGAQKWYTVTRTLLDQVLSELSTQVDRSGVVPATISWDNCSCGALYASTGLVYISETFPDQRASADLSDACWAPYEVGEVILQLMRCAPVATGQKLAPSVTELDASAQMVRQDAYEVMKAVSFKLCAMREAMEIENYIIDTQMPLGPLGACVGTELRLRVGLQRN